MFSPKHIRPSSLALQVAIEDIVRRTVVPADFKGKVVVHHCTDSRERLQVEVELRPFVGDIQFKRCFLDADSIKYAVISRTST